ncbi:MAG: hypothetical protein H7A25_26435 [Leptospiraceae bacterium]|nr:hypothetical protein [Leptospiraceae bacterium]
MPLKKTLYLLLIFLSLFLFNRYILFFKDIGEKRFSVKKTSLTSRPGFYANHYSAKKSFHITKRYYSDWLKAEGEWKDHFILIQEKEGEVLLLKKRSNPKPYWVKQEILSSPGENLKIFLTEETPMPETTISTWQVILHNDTHFYYRKPMLSEYLHFQFKQLLSFPPIGQN